MPTTVFVDQSTVDLDALHALGRGEVDMVAFNTPIRLHRKGWEQNVDFHRITRDTDDESRPYVSNLTSHLVVWFKESDALGGFPLTVRYGGGNTYLVDATISEDIPV